MDITFTRGDETKVTNEKFTDALKQEGWNVKKAQKTKQKVKKQDDDS